MQELFVMYLSKLAQKAGDNENEVNYSDLAMVVQRKESMLFLHDIVPKKIKFKQYLAMMQEDKDKDDDII